jgi:MFS family permease
LSFVPMQQSQIVPGGRYSFYVLYLLLFVYVSNQWCRYLLNYLYSVSYSDLSDSKADFESLTYSTGLTAAEYGLLVGYGFSTTYVTMGLVMGRAADMHNRKYIIFAGLLIWNAATFFIGLSSNFWQLMLSRILLGVGEAFSGPASYSLIADYFPADRRAEANGIYAFGIYVGGGLSSLSIAMAETIGWRGSCFVITCFGALLAVMVFVTLKEPERKNDSKKQEVNDETYSFRDSLKEIFSNNLIIILYIASSARFMAGYAIGGYVPSFYGTVFADYDDTYSYLNAFVVATGGALSSYIGGRAADRWEKSGNPYARLDVPLIGSLLGIPTIALCVLSTNFYLSMFGLFLEYLTAECWFGPIISVIQNALPSRVRGTGIACFTFTTTFFGSLASYLIGVWVDDVTSDLDEHTGRLRYIILFCVATCYFTASVLFYFARRFIDVPEDKKESSPLLRRQRENEV